MSDVMVDKSRRGLRKKKQLKQDQTIQTEQFNSKGKRIGLQGLLVQNLRAVVLCVFSYYITRCY